MEGFIVSKIKKERLFASTLLAGVASLGVPLAVWTAVVCAACSRDRGGWRRD